MNLKHNHWKTLNRKTTDMALERAIDALADLIEVVHKRNEHNNINTSDIYNMIDKLREIVDQKEGENE